MTLTKNEEKILHYAIDLYKGGIIDDEDIKNIVANVYSLSIERNVNNFLNNTVDKYALKILKKAEKMYVES